MAEHNTTTAAAAAARMGTPYLIEPPHCTTTTNSTSSSSYPPPTLMDSHQLVVHDITSSDSHDLRFEFPSSLENDRRNRNLKRQTPYVYRDQDRFVPINNIGRTMRNSVPTNGKVSKDAKECMQECVSEFISFLASEASDRCIDEKRKTITGDDILYALSNLGFDKYVDPLQLYLKKYRQYSRCDNKGDKEGETSTTEEVH